MARRLLVTLFFVTLVSGCGSTVTPASEFGDASAPDTRARDSAVPPPGMDSTTPPIADTNTPDTTIVTDTGGVTDTGAPFDSKPPPFDTATPPPDGAVMADKTTGKVCKIDDDCDLTGAGINLCTEGAFGGDSLYPTSVCIGRECMPGDATVTRMCDGDTGICLATSTGGICLPKCDFNNSGAAPTGCVGKNKCNAYSFGKDATTGGAIGLGYCFGGCRADGDCPVGNVCQVEEALCVKTKVTYTKLPGDACTDLDAKAPAKCSCLYTTAEKKGYCANVCYVGDTTCGTGFTCDPSLPRVALFPTDPVFTKAPAGIAGYCLKNCTTDADCATLNAYCEEMAGTGKKTCQVGKRPCATTAQCPTGKTCMGATTTTPGTCG